ncbi:YbcC family protein [Halofilum ochraceum]|uniref:YbcC family protein n=1 Tax=Halofilum ochraceum TaxID=1611323 RepID=UPI000A44CA92|nr:DUF2309 domain-containing protein [Halofilum ochraceum]
MIDNPQHPATAPREVVTAVESAVRAIPPAWPLSATVAVNPFLGQTEEPLWQAQARLRRVGGSRATPSRDWYEERIESGRITDADLAAALEASPASLRPRDVAALKAAAATPAAQPVAVATVAELAQSVSGIDWPGLIEERIGAWAASHFDEGQALWVAPAHRGVYDAWRWHATHDLTPEIQGLRGFARHVADAPDTADRAIARAVDRLGLSPDALETAFHRLLMTLGGWSQYGRWRLWQAELRGQEDVTAAELLAVRLVWEEALFQQYGDALRAAWTESVERHAAPVEADADDVIDAILQDAAERAEQRSLAAALGGGAAAETDERPVLQAAFCIDVRSEVFRRALESIDERIRTLGFAGFFGVATAHRRFASDVEEPRLPVLLNPAVHSCATPDHKVDADRRSRILARARRAWGRFKLAAVSSFAFVEAMGPVYAGKLVRDTLGMPAHRHRHDPAPRFTPELDDQARVDAAERVLRAMSLTSGFARVVVVAGHGADVVNNPHASALQCGACGGYSGEVNARLLAGLLNDPMVRAGIAERGITIPEDTLFVGALHDTTTDTVDLFDADVDTHGHGDDLARVRRWLASAGAVARGERMLRLPRGDDGGVPRHRARDWSEIRPEWGLAGCNAFVAAPRHRTAGRQLEGRAFLHDYDWRQDDGYGVLELILTAPVVVASWISLQYYGSTVVPEHFGGGNKLLHNVTGGIGVVEGNGGLLRTGLPWQSVHDGERLVHEPLRLTVCVEAPTDAIEDILARHEGVRRLFDNGWLHLFALDEEGRMAWRYAGGLRWLPGTEVRTDEFAAGGAAH